MTSKRKPSSIDSFTSTRTTPFRQACLDHTFKGQRASCLVNPRAGYETELHLPPTTQKKKLAVVRACVRLRLSGESIDENSTTDTSPFVCV